MLIVNYVGLSLKLTLVGLKEVGGNFAASFVVQNMDISIILTI
jgi:hypothetical protein